MSKKNPKDSDIKPSDMFINAMSECGMGSGELTCGWCNRLHLCPDSNYSSDSGEDEGDARRKYCEDEYKANPDNVVLHYDCDGVSGRYMNDVFFVMDCPCNGLHRYEQFIWTHKDTIRNYLKVRIEQEHRWAEEQLTLNKLAGI
jgi:hypothetical protein